MNTEFHYYITWLNTTPDSEKANRIIDTAIRTGNLHRIGIACHEYADTWAHQNFAGYFDPLPPILQGIADSGSTQANNPEESGAVIPHGGVCEGAVG